MKEKLGNQWLSAGTHVALQSKSMKEKKLGNLWLYADPNITFLVKSLFVNGIVLQEQIFLIRAFSII